MQTMARHVYFLPVREFPGAGELARAAETAASAAGQEITARANANPEDLRDAPAGSLAAVLFTYADFDLAPARKILREVSAINNNGNNNGDAIVTVAVAAQTPLAAPFLPALRARAIQTLFANTTTDTETQQSPPPDIIEIPANPNQEQLLPPLTKLLSLAPGHHSSESWNPYDPSEKQQSPPETTVPPIKDGEGTVPSKQINPPPISDGGGGGGETLSPKTTTAPKNPPPTPPIIDGGGEINPPPANLLDLADRLGFPLIKLCKKARAHKTNADAAIPDPFTAPAAAVRIKMNELMRANLPSPEGGGARRGKRKHTIHDPRHPAHALAVVVFAALCHRFREENAAQAERLIYDELRAFDNGGDASALAPVIALVGVLHAQRQTDEGDKPAAAERLRAILKAQPAQHLPLLRALALRSLLRAEEDTDAAEEIAEQLSQTAAQLSEDDRLAVGVRTFAAVHEAKKEMSDLL